MQSDATLTFKHALSAEADAGRRHHCGFVGIGRTISGTGIWQVFSVNKATCHTWNHKRVYRVYCGLKMNRRRIGKKRLPTRAPQPLAVPGEINKSWSIDFMSDALWCGRRFRTFNVVDDFNREVLAIEVDLNLPASRVIRVLERIVAWRGFPVQIRMDNGPEFISATLADWAHKHDVHLEFIEPG